jgi:hypothetical protein
MHDKADRGDFENAYLKFRRNSVQPLPSSPGAWAQQTVEMS